MTDNYNNVNQLSSALEEEHRLYKTLLGMTIAQKNAAETGDVSAIIRILKDRVKVIAAIDAVSLKTKAMSDDKLNCSSMVSGLVLSINEMINKIMDYDAKSQVSLSGISKEIEDRLSEINEGLRKVKCLPKTSPPPKFISLKL